MNSLLPRRSLLIASLSAAPLAVPVDASAQGVVEIRGIVTSSKGEPIPGAVVRVDRPGGGSGSGQTDAAGKYSFGVPSGTPISTLSYSHSQYDTASLMGLSGTTPQAISKVMYIPGESRPAQAVAETLAAYEQLIIALITAPQERRAQLAADYRKENWLGRLDKLPLPGGELDEWLGVRKKNLLAYFQSKLPAR